MDVDPSIHPPGYLSSPCLQLFHANHNSQNCTTEFSHPKLQVVFNIAVTPWLTHAINYRRAMAHAFSHAVHVQPSAHSMVQILETTHVCVLNGTKIFGGYRFIEVERSAKTKHHDVQFGRGRGMKLIFAVFFFRAPCSLTTIFTTSTLILHMWCMNIQKEGLSNDFNPG